MTDKFEIAVKLGRALLLKHGQISVQEIRSIPYVRSRDEAFAVARRLANTSNPYYSVEVVDDRWDGDIKLRVELDETRIAARMRTQTPA